MATNEELVNQMATLTAQMAEQQRVIAEMQRSLVLVTDRAQRVETSMSDLLKVSAAAVSKAGEKDIVDGRAVGQPFKFSGKGDQDFAEWTSKFTDFIKAKIGNSGEDAFKWSGCTGTLNFGCWNMGEIPGAHYTGGNNKVSQYLTDIPSCENAKDPRYLWHGNPALRFISERIKHASVGNEAYGFEDGGDIARCSGIGVGFAQGKKLERSL